MAATDSPKTLQQAIQHYSDLAVCQQELAEARWPNGVECPQCGSKEVSYLTNQRRWQCKDKTHPKRQFSAKVGTIFEDSPIGLDKWFTAMWLIASAKNGISSYELHRAIGVTQKSAWFMLHRIRLAMQTRTFMKIDGEIEIDETYIGGKARNMHASKRRELFGGSHKRAYMGKVAVLGLLDRHGNDGTSQVRTSVVHGRKKGHLQPVVRQQVEAGATLNTDAHFSYQGLGRDYVHKVIDHAEAYVDGTVHTNGVENFWSLLKRTLKGTYVSVEAFHLFRYLDEQALRFNTRKSTDSARFTDLLTRVTGRRLTYRGLTGEEERAVGLA
jgi:transposase-like protein